MNILFFRKTKVLIGLFLMFFLTFNHFQCVIAQTTAPLKAKDLINLSFEDLMNVHKNRNINKHKTLKNTYCTDCNNTRRNVNIKDKKV